MDKILINASDTEECRVAMLDADGFLQEYYTDSNLRDLSLNNIYKGVIQNIEPSLQAVFVNYGNGKNGFLQISDIHPEYFSEKVPDNQRVDLKKVLKKGQEVLVQVLKEPTTLKGAALTTYISIAGRFVVLTLGRDQIGISRKIESEDERNRLKKISEQLPLPNGYGYIIRTVAEDKSKKEMATDLWQVYNLWENIRAQSQKAQAPALIYREQDLAIKILRDNFTTEVKEVIIDDLEAYQRILEYIKIIDPEAEKKVKLHKEKRPIFARHQLEDQLETIYQTKVRLKSGGSIVITPTEALVAIDVNSGKGTKEDNLEQTALNTNLEAASEVGRQLRLRDLGGLVVVDFIDMRDEKNRRQVEKKMREAVKLDKAKTDISYISKFGLLELSRQRLRPSIESGNYVTCERCRGRGIVKTSENASLGILRQITHALAKGEVKFIKVKLNSDVAFYLLNYKRLELAKIEEKYKARIVLISETDFAPGFWELETFKKDIEEESAVEAMVKYKVASVEETAARLKEELKGFDIIDDKKENIPEKKTDKKPAKLAKPEKAEKPEKIEKKKNEKNEA